MVLLPPPSSSDSSLLKGNWRKKSLLGTAKKTLSRQTKKYKHTRALAGTDGGRMHGSRIALPPQRVCTSQISPFFLPFFSSNETEFSSSSPPPFYPASNFGQTTDVSQSSQVLVRLQLGVQEKRLLLRLLSRPLQNGEKAEVEKERKLSASSRILSHKTRRL